jgi:hypothetical protein
LLGTANSRRRDDGKQFSVTLVRVHRVVPAVAILLSACRADDPFVCANDEQCRRTGLTDGKCEASLNCSFPDVDCPTGRRYDVLATHSGECVVDDDQDMIADDGDNCPGIANPGQEDEDADNRGDPCDPCPPFSEQTPGSGDEDGDGVGNLCDPSPTSANKILLFEGFHAPLPSSWSVNGAGLVENDGLTLQNASDATLPLPSTGPDMLLAGVALKAMPATGAWLGLAYQSGVGGAYCELTTSKLQLWSVGAPNRLVREASFMASLDKEYVYGIKHDKMAYTCTAGVTPRVMPTQVSGASVTNATVPEIHIGGDVTTHYSWVLLIGEQ